ADRAVRLRALVPARASHPACRAFRARSGEQGRHHVRLSLVERLRLLVLSPLVLSPVSLHRPEPTRAGK
ncbi:hypothetical protein, partial [Streptomyces sp. SID8385]|uniref:hypothetical protein n=1 Tax=Streptomyces sp. SID8385 TaxID=2690364 RepID=UPI001925FDAF